MRRGWSLGPLALLGLVAGTAIAEDLPPPPQFSAVPIPDGQIDMAVGKVDDLVAEIMRRTGVPGVAVAVVKDGELRAVLGTPGGPTITTTVSQLARAIVDYGMTVDQAVESARAAYQANIAPFNAGVTAADEALKSVTVPLGSITEFARNLGDQVGMMTKLKWNNPVNFFDKNKVNVAKVIEDATNRILGPNGLA